jgi:hypothetical protein
MLSVEALAWWTQAHRLLDFWSYQDTANVDTRSFYGRLFLRTYSPYFGLLWFYAVPLPLTGAIIAVSLGPPLSLFASYTALPLPTPLLIFVVSLLVLLSFIAALTVATSLWHLLWTLLIRLISLAAMAARLPRASAATLAVAFLTLGFLLQFIALWL